MPKKNENRISNWIRELKFWFEPDDIVQASQGDKVAIDKIFTIIYQQLHYAKEHLVAFNGWSRSDVELFHTRFINRIVIEYHKRTLFAGESLKQFCKISIQDSLTDADRIRKADMRRITLEAESIDKISIKGFEASDDEQGNDNGQKNRLHTKGGYIRSNNSRLDRCLVFMLRNKAIEEIRNDHHREIMRLYFSRQALSYADIKKIMEARTETCWTESNIGSVVSREFKVIVKKLQSRLNALDSMYVKSINVRGESCF